MRSSDRFCGALSLATVLASSLEIAKVKDYLQVDMPFAQSLPSAEALPGGAGTCSGDFMFNRELAEDAVSLSGTRAMKASAVGADQVGGGVTNTVVLDQPD